MQRGPHGQCGDLHYQGKCYNELTKKILHPTGNPENYIPSTVLLGSKVFILVKVHKTQCGNFKIFVSLRFYVKSILWILEVKKTAVFTIFGAVNFVLLLNFSLQKVKNA